MAVVLNRGAAAHKGAMRKCQGCHQFFFNNFYYLLQYKVHFKYSCYNFTLAVISFIDIQTYFSIQIQIQLTKGEARQKRLRNTGLWYGSTSRKLLPCKNRSRTVILGGAPCIWHREALRADPRVDGYTSIPMGKLSKVTHL